MAKAFHIDVINVVGLQRSGYAMRKIKHDHYVKIKAAKVMAGAFAPRRTGDLARKFTARLSYQTSVSTTYRLTNTAKYAKYVFKDTRGAVIVPKRGKRMPVGKSRYSRRRGRTLTPDQLKSVTLKDRVSGYPKNRTMERAINTAFARQGIHF